MESSAKPSFIQATKVEKLDSHTYRVNLSEAFCIAAVPNGGYTSSCILAVARTHLPSQPDTLTAHFEYPNRTAISPGIVVVEDVKRGKQLSTLHLTLWQGDGLLPRAPWITPSASRRCVLAYANLTDLSTFTGMSVPTAFESTPAAMLPSPLPDFAALKSAGGDARWAESTLPATAGAALQRSLANWRFYLPRGGDALTPGVVDMWLCTASGERITQGMLAYVCDSFPFNMHTFLMAPELRALLAAPPPPPPPRERSRGGNSSAGAQEEEMRQKNENRASLWYPTVVMNLEVKMALPAEGVEWLAVRVMSRQIKDGRFDIDLAVRDVDGDLVALSNQVELILSIERNTAKRGTSTATTTTTQGGAVSH